MNLKDKFLDYLYNQNHMTIKSIYAEPIALDLADMAEKICKILADRNVELIKEKNAVIEQLNSIMADRNKEYFKVGKLQKENTELKEQLNQLKKSLNERGIVT